MKLSISTLATTLLLSAGAATPETSRNFVKFVDPESKAVSYLLKPGQFAFNQQSIYFTTQSMTDDGRFLIFDGSNDERDKPANHSKHVWFVDFLTDEVHHLAVIGGKIPFLDVKTGELYWIDGSGVHKRDLRTGGKTDILVCPLPPELISKNKPNKTRYCTHLTLTADRTQAFLDVDIDGKYIQGMLNLKTGKWTQWTDADFCCNHGQINPANDRLALVAMEYASTMTLPELGRERLPGEKLRCPPYVTNIWRPRDTVYPRLWLCEPGRKTMIPPALFNYATHENFTADGKAFYYCAKGVVLCDLASRRQWRVNPISTQHATMSADLRYVTGDCSRDGWYRGCAWTCMFWNRDTHRGMYIFSKRPRLNPREDESKLHPDPHPQFVAKDRYIVSTMIGEDHRMNLCVTPVAPLIAATSDPATAPQPKCAEIKWSIDNPTDIPYEVEINNRQLIDLGILSKPFATTAVPSSAFAVEAKVKGKSLRVPVTGLKGMDEKHVRLRFLPPTGTERLTVIGDVSERFDVEGNASCDNILWGMLDEQNAPKWTPDADTMASISRVRDGILITGKCATRKDDADCGGVSYKINLPPRSGGKPVQLEMDVRSLSSNEWENAILIQQIDGNGKPLPGFAVDPNEIGKKRSPMTTCFIRKGGMLHPSAEALQIRFLLPCAKQGNTAPLEDGKLLITHAVLRLARTLQAPKPDAWHAQ